MIALAIVPIFMIFYYRFAGVVSVVALVINMILLDRLDGRPPRLVHPPRPRRDGFDDRHGGRCERLDLRTHAGGSGTRGATLGQQIRNGFARAWVTILDSHLTIFLSGLVLYIIGTEEIKGFALTLLIGMIWNLFTAVYCSRVIFDLWYDQGWLKKITMFKILDKTQIDFITPKKYLIPGSVIVILIGLAIFAYRRNQMFNIDFTGGTLITIRLDDNAPAIKNLSEGDRAAYVRSEASKVLLDPAVETLNVGNERRGLRFNIRTTETDIASVQQKILKEFGPVLARLDMTVGASTPIPETKAPEKPDAAKKDADAATPTANPFAGGRSYALTFNRPVDPAGIRAAFSRVLAAAKVPNPDSRFSVVKPEDVDAVSATSERLVLSTNLEPDQAKADLTLLTGALRDDPNLLFDRQENFGGAVGRRDAKFGHRRRRGELADHHRLRLAPLQEHHLRHGRGHRPGPRRPHHPRRRRDLPLQDRPADGRRVPDADRLLDQRHDRHLRPHPRAEGQESLPDQGPRQPRRQRDVEPDHPDLADRLAGGRRHVRLRRRRAPRLLVLPRRRLPQRHVQHRLHREPDPHRLDRRRSEGYGEPEAGAGDEGSLISM